MARWACRRQRRGATFDETRLGAPTSIHNPTQREAPLWRTLRETVSPELEGIREQQRAFLKANHKFPDFIEVGIGVWEGVCDWHVRHQLPIEILRNAEGRYMIAVIGTTLLLRPEQADTFVGFGFDAR